MAAFVSVPQCSLADYEALTDFVLGHEACSPLLQTLFPMPCSNLHWPMIKMRVGQIQTGGLQKVPQPVAVGISHAYSIHSHESFVLL